MSSGNKTPNLQLNQWKGNEYLKRTDFIEDNKKIDDAYKELKDSIKDGGKVSSVNDKIGDVILKAGDIKTNSGVTVESQMAEITKQVESIEVTAEKTTLDSDKFKSKNVKAGMEELFTSVSNGKKSIATAITGKGVQASSNDTHQQLATKIGEIETFKDNLLPFLPYKELHSTKKWTYYSTYVFGNGYIAHTTYDQQDSSSYSGTIYKIYKTYFSGMVYADSWLFTRVIQEAVYITDNTVWSSDYYTSKRLDAYNLKGTKLRHIEMESKIEDKFSKGKVYVNELESKIYYYTEYFAKLIIFDFNGTILKTMYLSSIENPRIIGKYIIGETQSPYELKIYSLEGTILKRITRKYTPAFTEYAKLNSPVIIEDNIIRSVRAVYNEEKITLFETVLDKLI